MFTKHDHTQFKLLASGKDPKYSQTPLSYLSFASNNNTKLDFYHNCDFAAPFVDNQLATKYAPIGHPLLLEDPDFDAPIDKRNCKKKFLYLCYYFQLIPAHSITVQGWRDDANSIRPRNTSIATSSHWVALWTVNRPDIKCDCHFMLKRLEMLTCCCHVPPIQTLPLIASTSSSSADGYV